MTEGPTMKVVAKRRYRAPRERVFRAFTDPAELTRWFSPSEDIATDVIDLELRAGGVYRFGFHLPGGAVDYVLGTFEEVSPPGRLVFTWTWAEPDPHAGIETLVTVEFIEHGDETEVVVTHDRFPNEETRARHDAGWQGTFDRLAKLLNGLESE